MFKNLRSRLRKVQDEIEDNLDAQLEAQLEEELQQELAKDSNLEKTRAEPPEPEPPLEEISPAPPTEEVEVPPTDLEAPANLTQPTPEDATQAAPLVEESIEAPEAFEPPQPSVETTEQAKEPVTGRKQLSEQEIESRLQRELGEAVEIEKEVEQIAGVAETRYTINEEILEDILWELEVGLLESDVALPVIEAIKHNIKEQLLTLQVGAQSPAGLVEKVLRSAIQRVLSGQTMDFDAIVENHVASGELPLVVMFVGVNGTGKTTTIARIAHRLQSQGHSPVLAAGDTFRAGAIEQLTQHADKLGVKIIKHAAGGDPAAVAYDAIEHAKARNKPVVLLDTAGRMQTNTNLMDEMDKIRRVAKPDLVLFVGDSLAGNDAVEQARRFDEVVDIDGAVLTKVDVDAKGGAALSVAYTVNKPLVFVGIGQGYDDLRPFDAKWMVDRLFGEAE